MPRRAREKSGSGVYHIMVRGINREDIFTDEQDRQNYLSTLKKYKDICGYEVYGYCLMSNHVHLLLREGTESIGQAMKRIGARYVYLYNTKYERCGHLFQDRFKSEAVEDDRYLMAVLRYIHQNPVQAGLVDAPADYQWSSYNEYVYGKGYVTDTRFFLNLLNPDTGKAVELFKEFMLEENEDSFLDDVIKPKKILSDQEALDLIAQMTSGDDPWFLQMMDRQQRNAVIRKIRAEGVSIRQLSQLSGLNRGIIERATATK